MQSALEWEGRGRQVYQSGLPVAGEPLCLGLVNFAAEAAPTKSRIFCGSGFSRETHVDKAENIAGKQV
jgi:hypothetical protein